MLGGGALPIVGREPELRRVDEFLDAIQAGPIALVLEGEIGIGKTALWKQGLAAAVARSHRVLSCRPIDTEAQLAYAALGDLLAEVPEEVLTQLPGPQRHALEAALLRVEPAERQSLPRAVALGLLGVLRALARQDPTVVGFELLAARGFLELSLGDAAGADRTLSQLAELVAAAGCASRRCSASTATPSRPRSPSATGTRRKRCSTSSNGSVRRSSAPGCWRSRAAAVGC